MKFRNSRGVFYTKAVFKEWNEEAEPHFTLKEYDHHGLPSMYLLYMQCVDEWDFVTKHLDGSMQHWEKFQNTKWFMDGEERLGHRGLKYWREDMRMRDESLAKRVMMQEAEGGSVAAAKALKDLSAKPKGPGRPKGTTKEAPKLAVDNVSNFLSKVKEG